MNKKLLFREAIIMQPFFLIIIWLPIISGLVISILLITDIVVWSSWLKIIIYLVTGLLLFSAINLCFLKIIIKENFWQFGFGIFKQRLNWSQIKGVYKVEKLSVFFNHLGIRYLAGNKIGYLASWGSGIELKVDGRSYYFSTHQADKIIEIFKINSLK